MVRNGCVGTADQAQPVGARSSTLTVVASGPTEALGADSS